MSFQDSKRHTISLVCRTQNFEQASCEPQQAAEERLEEGYIFVGSIKLHQMAASLGSFIAKPSKALLFGRPCLRPQRYVASSTVTQAINKQEFIEAVKQNIKSSPGVKSLSNSEFDQIVLGVFSTITTKVAAGETVNITGFGKFERR